MFTQIRHQSSTSRISNTGPSMQTRFIAPPPCRCRHSSCPCHRPYAHGNLGFIPVLLPNPLERAEHGQRAAGKDHIRLFFSSSPPERLGLKFSRRWSRRPEVTWTAFAEAFKFLPLIGVFPALIAQKGGIFPPGNRIQASSGAMPMPPPTSQIFDGIPHLESLAQRRKDIQLVARAALESRRVPSPSCEKANRMVSASRSMVLTLMCRRADAPRIEQADMGKLPGGGNTSAYRRSFKRQRIGVLCQRLQRSHPADIVFLYHKSPNSWNIQGLQILIRLL